MVAEAPDGWVYVFDRSTGKRLAKPVPTEWLDLFSAVLAPVPSSVEARATRKPRKRARATPETPVTPDTIEAETEFTEPPSQPR